MKLEDVQARVKEIEDVAGDYEVAHIREDELYADILKAIANGEIHSIEEAKLLCAEALKTEQIDFARWCA